MANKLALGLGLGLGLGLPVLAGIAVVLWYFLVQQKKKPSQKPTSVWGVTPWTPETQSEKLKKKEEEGRRNGS